ncbi:MAG: ABC transporter permease, partial [Liquorilactobacillus sp.]|uniref:ABC transporter permease n=1 Tax=Liquorilactobacillus sp. TaxID=2767923 RepID=UPI0039E7F919
LLIVAVVVFVITRLLPGDPASAMLGPQASVSEIHKLRQQLGLNQSLIKQFIIYCSQLLHFNLGTSYTYNEPVINLIMSRFPNTVILTVFSMILALIFGIGSGVIASVKKNSWIDYFVTVLSLIGVSMPVFWLGVMLVLIFSVNLQLLPATGMASLNSGITNFLKHIILPAITLATIPTANFSRITRASMLDVLGENYIRTAKAKGLNNFSIILKHALKNAMIPILTTMGMEFSSMLGGAVLTETIFSWPGMGKLIVDAIDKRDFVVVQGTVLFLALIFVLINLGVDLLYKVVNPRIQYVKKE